MHCPQCGLEQFGEGTVCYNCGAKLPQVQPPPMQGPPPRSSSSSSPYPPPSYDVYGSPPAGPQPPPGQPYPAGPPPGYGYPPMGPVPYQKPGRPGSAIAALVLGILFFIPFCGFVALILGIVALKKIKKENYAEGTGLAIAGIVLGVIGILFTFYVIWALVLYLWIVGTMTSGMNGMNTPNAIFMARNAGDQLSESEFDDDVATITLLEGDLLTNEIQIMISADGDEFFDYTSYDLVPDNDPKSQWNPGEALIISEDKAPSQCLDMNGNWKSTSFYVRIIYKPLAKMMYTESVTLETST